MNKYNIRWDLKTAKRIILVLIFGLPHFLIHLIADKSAILADLLDDFIVKLSR